jgi:hypothetical protein
MSISKISNFNICDVCKYTIQEVEYYEFDDGENNKFHTHSKGSGKKINKCFIEFKELNPEFEYEKKFIKPHFIDDDWRKHKSRKTKGHKCD